MMKGLIKEVFEGSVKQIVLTKPRAKQFIFDRRRYSSSHNQRHKRAFNQSRYRKNAGYMNALNRVNLIDGSEEQEICLITELDLEFESLYTQSGSYAENNQDDLYHYVAYEMLNALKEGAEIPHSTFFDKDYVEQFESCDELDSEKTDDNKEKK